MKIRVDFYKPNGKWYAHDIVDVGDTLPGSDEFKQAIVNNQNILHDGWQGDFYVITDNINDDDLFAKFLFHPVEFAGFNRSKS